MTGTPTVNSLLHIFYDVLVLLILSGFAVYDAIKKRVPDLALVFFIPMALGSPFVGAMNRHVGVMEWGQILPYLFSSVLGAALGFGILLAAALLSKGGAGVGGGDIKMAAVLGFIYGPYGVTGVMLFASLLAMPIGLIYKKRSGRKNLHMPFVPFLTVGAACITLLKIIQ